MYQIAALAALEHAFEGFSGSGCASYIGSSSGASVAAALAAGRDVQRIYRAFLDPADDYFPLERRHILRMDIAEWRRTARTALGALGQGSRSLLRRAEPPSPAALWEELARLYDSMPAGLFSLDAYERFLEDNFLRRGVPNQFRNMPAQLRILAHELDSGKPVVFGSQELEHVAVSRACIASMATPPLFSPVRIGEQHYFNPSPSQVSHVDVAVALGADIIVVVNPMVPMDVSIVPTGHGVRTSVRDKGAMWVANQANRIKLHSLLKRSIERVRRETSAKVLVVEPEPTDGTMFMHNPASFPARRTILESSYLATRERTRNWLDDDELVKEAGWAAARSDC
jgi:predicted acylesterase/phospholipase RssA